MSLAAASVVLALAAPFGETPVRPLSTAATCLQAAGAPGELVRQTERSVQFLRAGERGLTPGAVLPVDRGSEGCAAIAAARGGASVVAFTTYQTAGNQTLSAYLREPGASFGPAAVVMPLDNAGVPEFRAAVSERGDALVAAGTASFGRNPALRVARRAPGGAFGTPVTLWSARTGDEPRVRVGLSASGHATVAWASRPSDAVTDDLWVADAPAGEAFGAPRRIGTIHPGALFELAVAPDGRALLVYPSGTQLLAAERVPGAEWGAPVALAESASLIAARPAVALRPDGAAVVAWVDGIRGTVQARLRGPSEPFGSVAELDRGLARIGRFGAYLGLLNDLFTAVGGVVGFSDISIGPTAAGPRVSFADDGRALVTWTGADERDGVWWGAPHAALLGATIERSVLGAELRDAGDSVPVLTTGGAPAVAWTDNSSEKPAGRIHLAIEGASAAADPPAPRVTVGRPARSVLPTTDFLVLPVRCSAACDVRAHVAGTFDNSGVLSLTEAGNGRLRIDADLEPSAPLRAGPVRILVRYGAPGAQHATARTKTVTLRRTPTPPAPRVRGLTARRDGNAVVVRWLTLANTEPDRFLVLGRDANGTAISFDEEGLDDDGLDGPQRAFSFRLDGKSGKVVRVTLATAGEYVSTLRSYTVAVR